jgi:hypothetical protein
MHGLAELEHHVVGDVDDRGDRAKAGALDARLHPRGRRRARVDALDDPRRETRAGAGVVDAHGALRLAGDGSLGDAGQHQRRAGDRGDFTRNAGERQAVGAVRGQLDRDHRVVESEHLAQVLSRQRIVGQRQQAGGVIRQPELARRAQHALRFDAAHRRALDGLATGQHGPSSAQGTSMPAAALGAPQTTCSSASRPTFTAHTRRRSASGCGVALTISPTTTFANSGAARATSSTSKPAIVSLSHSAAVSIGGSTNVRSQASENCIVYANCFRKRRSFS